MSKPAYGMPIWLRLLFDVVLFALLLWVASRVLRRTTRLTVARTKPVIRFVSFGSEEAGCPGSGRYVARHLDGLKRLDVQVLNCEMIAHPEATVLTSETNGTVKNSPEMVKCVIAAAERAGVPYRVQSATLGTGSDAGPFSRFGLKATTLVGFGMRQQVAFYHQKRDTPEVLTLEPPLDVLELTFEWLRDGGE